METQSTHGYKRKSQPVEQTISADILECLLKEDVGVNQPELATIPTTTLIENLKEANAKMREPLGTINKRAIARKGF